jgi:rhodanese-related sulfurtransferase
MERLNKIVTSMDFEFMASGINKVTAANFLKESDSLFVDIRCKEEVETISLNLKHHMEAINIPFHEFPARLNELPKDRRIGLFCSGGVRIAMAYLYLRTAGFESVVMISGGLDAIVSELKPGKVFKQVNINNK